MREGLVEEVVAEVRRRWGQPGGNALLLGRRPAGEYGWNYVASGEYEAVVIGSMSAGELLHFPDEICTEALLAGKPVYVCREGLDYRRYGKTSNRVLWGKLLAAERQMKQLGVQFLGAQDGALLTAQEVRRLLREGRPVPPGSRLTPLAKDVLEGKQ